MSVRDPEAELQSLQKRFRRIRVRYERAERRRRGRMWPLAVALVALLSFGGFLALFLLSPWSPAQTLAHLAAFTGCDAARTFGIDEARPGNPGYWSRLDSDDDGVACERSAREFGHVIVPT